MYGERQGSHFGGGFRGRQGGFGGKFAPVKVGDELDVKIESVGAKGDGVAKVEGFVLFVPGTKEGQEVRVKVTRVLRKVGFAEVVGEGAPSEESKEEPSEEFGEEPEPSEEFGEETEEAAEEPTEETTEEPAEETKEEPTEETKEEPTEETAEEPTEETKEETKEE